MTAYLDEKAGADNAAIDQIQKDEMAKYKVAIEEQKEAQVMASSYEELIQAKKEAVGLQLEAEYRSRLQNAYSQVNFNPFILGKSAIRLYEVLLMLRLLDICTLSIFLR